MLSENVVDQTDGLLTGAGSWEDPVATVAVVVNHTQSAGHLLHLNPRLEPAEKSILFLPSCGLVQIIRISGACAVWVPPPPPVFWPGRCWEMSGRPWTRSARSREEKPPASSRCTAWNRKTTSYVLMTIIPTVSPGSSHCDPLLAGYDVNVVSVEGRLDPGGRHPQYLKTNQVEQFEKIFWLLRLTCPLIGRTEVSPQSCLAPRPEQLTATSHWPREHH